VSREPPPKEVLLNPGEYAFGEGRTRLRTLLGSCVAITFWHPRHQVGAMCHYLLPTRPQGAPDADDGKYAEDVVPLIATRFRNQGLQPGEFEVKMFGGSNMFPGLDLSGVLTVGAKNIFQGQVLLEQAGFRLQASDLAGEVQRLVVFEVWNGDVWVRSGSRTPRAAHPRTPHRRGTP
jgi:chemotaxis protein CheD